MDGLEISFKESYSEFVSFYTLFQNFKLLKERVLNKNWKNTEKI